jgi:hypothetical protein
MVLLACATTARRVPVRPAARDDKGVSFLPFASSRVERFSDQEGRPCPAFGGRVRNNVLGWESGNEDDPACTHGGKVDVDWFGFSAVEDNEVNRIFGIRPKPEAPAAQGLTAH